MEVAHVRCISFEPDFEEQINSVQYLERRYELFQAIKARVNKGATTLVGSITGPLPATVFHHIAQHPQLQTNSDKLCLASLQALQAAEADDVTRKPQSKALQAIEAEWQESTFGRRIIVGAIDCSTHEFDLCPSWSQAFGGSTAYLSVCRVLCQLPTQRDAFALQNLPLNWHRDRAWMVRVRTWLCIAASGGWALAASFFVRRCRTLNRHTTTCSCTWRPPTLPSRCMRSAASSACRSARRHVTCTPPSPSIMDPSTSSSATLAPRIGRDSDRDEEALCRDWPSPRAAATSALILESNGAAVSSLCNARATRCLQPGSVGDLRQRGDSAGRRVGASAGRMSALQNESSLYRQQTVHAGELRLLPSKVAHLFSVRWRAQRAWRGW
mmetsp:Transcript_49080/g.98407  ORF Transcript_49080/g.98407 Transcript_49080/m.98407 type:complete len:384 (+) Transcript_49080:167-1318(+)